MLLQTLVLHRLEQPWALALVDALVSVSLLAALAFAASFMHRYYQPGRENWTYVVVFVLVDSVLYSVVLLFVMNTLFSNQPEYLVFLERSMPVRLLFVIQCIGFVVMLNWIRNRLSDQKEMARRQQESERLMREAELARLRQQLHPHFLFNSLNSINALVGSQPEAARKMTQQLSDFLRGTIRKEDKLIPLREELEHLQLYLEIEKVRFGNRLEIQFDVLESSLRYPVPALLLQPLMENAIKFGLYDVLDRVCISLEAKVEAGFLCIRISNPFDPTSKPPDHGTGFGLQSVRRRLQLLYARPDLLSTSATSTTFYSLLRIPISA